MAKKARTGREEALDRYTYAADFEANSECTGLFDQLALSISASLRLSPDQSICAIRDYAQLRLAMNADARLEATQHRIADLQKQVREKEAQNG